MCSEYGIGVSTDDLEAGMVEIKNNNEFYRGNVKRYISTIDLERNLEDLSFAITKRFNEYLGEEQYESQK